MERVTRFRAIVMFLVVCALMTFLAGRLYYLQIVETGGEVDNTTTFTTATRVKAARGSITDRNGNVLVGNRASYDLVLNHYVLTNSENPNQSLMELVELCRELGIEYTEHLPLTKTAPFQDTQAEYSTTWQRYFQMFLESRDLDSDITAPLLFQELREQYGIPAEWSDEDARAVLGLRYELSLRALSGTGLSNYVFLSDVDNDSLAAISELNIPGMNVEASTVREYYTTYAAHVLGYVGSMSPSQWEYYKTVDTDGDGTYDYLMDAEVGQSGFESAFEEYLHGIDGWRYDEVTADGTVIKTWYDPAPVAGNNVEVTLDLTCQIAAEKEMAALFQAMAAQEEGKDGKDVEGGAVVAMDVRTGQILVCASYPTYDPTTFFSNYNELLKAEHNPLLNRALMGLYAPGSTYKMSMVVSAIDSGTINSQTTIVDEGRWWLSNDFYLQCLRWANSGGTHGAITAAEALKYSCNYFFYQLAHWMDPEITDSTAKGLGLGEDTGVELYGYTGYRANEETKMMLYSEENWGFYEPDRLQSSIGQSDNRFTPLQLCVYASTLANQGVRYRATFLNRVVSADYRTLIYEQLQDVVSTMQISDEAYSAVVTGMTMVAHESGGTAYSTFWNYPITIAAKTGTAQTGITGASDNGAMVCFAPADNPQIAIAVYGEKAGHGSSVASIAKAILDAYFQIGTEGEYSEIVGENGLG